MKKTLVLFIGLILLLVACNNKEPISEFNPDIVWNELDKLVNVEQIEISRNYIVIQHTDSTFSLYGRAQTIQTLMPGESKEINFKFPISN
jgi:uncharacterized lipoprotein NlpE involved in copper resistance